MSDMDPFEERLAAQQLREVPPNWRREILRNASAAAQARSVQPRWSYGALGKRFSALFWPNPTAWAGLAAVWLLILGLNVASRDYAEPMRNQPIVAASLQDRALLKLQEQMVVELLGSDRAPSHETGKPATPSPRSQRRESFFYT